MYPRNFCFGVCCLIALVAPIEARADLVTSFQGVTLDGNLHLDMPDSNVGSISLDTVNHNLLAPEVRVRGSGLLLASITGMGPTACGYKD